MKRILLPAMLLALGSSVALQAQNLVEYPQKINVAELQATHNTNDVSLLATPDRLEGIDLQSMTRRATPAAAMRRLPRLGAAAEVDTVQYFTIAQSYHSNYRFNYDGGDILSYNVGLAIDGTKATLTNLFDMYNQSASSWARSYDYPVDGVFDAEAKTITIATTVNGIVCGDYGGYYNAMLLAGEVSENGVMSPAEELVFDVTLAADGSVSSFTSRLPFCAKYDYGTILLYKSFTANLPQEGVANIVSFTESIDFGEAFVRSATSKTITVYNNGGMDADFAIELEAEDDAYTCDKMAGTIPAGSAFDLTFTMLSEKAGTYEGIATLTYENGAGESNLVIDLNGSVKDYPDYSAIVVNGNFDITTGIDFPFEMTTLEDGTVVATSTTYGAYGQSWLCFDFDVPEGKLANLAWKGMSNNSSYWYYNAGGYFIDTLDGAVATYQNGSEDISGSHEFAPGHHFIRFQYDGNYFSGLAENRLYVYGIDYQEQTLNADSAIVLTPEVSLGNGLLQPGATVSKTGVIVLRNTGANALTVSSAQSDNEEFRADLSSLVPAATMQEVSIPVSFESATAGDKQATFTIQTSAGTFTAVVKATVMQMPDFASLVTEGAEYITSWVMNEAYPFVLVDGKARNQNAGDNSVYSSSWFGMNISVPEGKLARVSWEGRAFGRPEVEGSYDHYYSSYATIDMTHPMTSGTACIYGSDVDAGSSALADHPTWGDYLACTAGNHTYKFGWYHNGDGTAPEGDYVEISNIKISVIDFAAHAVELMTPEVVFDSTYVGENRYTTAKVTLRNAGSEVLRVDSVGSNAPFYGLETTLTAQFNQTMDVTLWFYPAEPGEYEGDLTIYTNGGDVTVHCQGVARDAVAEGLLLVGDFEDDAQGWTVADYDNDGETWNLGYNLWGSYAPYCHSGVQCLGSVSYSNYLGAITPDNWTFSPVISIPEQGADLSYYVAAFHPTRYAEHYSLYVAEYGLDFSIEEVLTQEPVISETLEEEQGQLDGWARREFDLSAYAGQDVVLCFRHHDCNGQYIFRLDDVFVHAKQAVGVSGIKAEAKAEAQIYGIDGRQSQAMTRGINIIRTRQADGSVKVQKIIK